VFDPAESDQFVKSLSNLADERASGHGDDYIVGEAPAELLGDFKSMGFRAFGIVGAEVDVDQAPIKAVGDLRAETIDVVVVAVDAHDARAVDGGVKDLGGLEIGGDEDARVETLLRGLCGNGVGEVAGRGAANRFQVEAASGHQSGGNDAVLKGKRREAYGI